MTDGQLAGLTPTRIWRHRDQFVVTWSDLRGLPFDKPFFYETIQAAEGRPGPEPRHTPLAAMAAEAERRRAAGALASPSFIFHMARCGSTLVSLSLAQAKTARVLGEPNPLTDAVELAALFPPPARLALLRDLATLLAPPAGQPFVIKAMSALACHLPLFLAAFPGARWAFVYRDPTEVLVSLLRGGNFALTLHGEPQRAENVTGIPAATVAKVPPAVFATLVTERICATALACARRAQPGAFLAVPYRALPAAIPDRVAAHFGIAFTPEERAAVAALAARNAKDPSAGFKTDSAEKRSAAPQPLRETAEQRIAPIVDALDALA